MELFCSQREKANALTSENLKKSEFTPEGPLHLIESGASFISKIDSKWRRNYVIAQDENGNCA